MPDKGDRDLWWEFFAGEPESVWNRARPSRKKNKAKRQERHDTFGQGKMRAWDDEAGEVDDLGEQDIRQSNRSVTVNASLGPTEPEPSTIATDEGEVENALKIEPQDSLPTPTGTPVPSDGMEPAITAGSLSLVTEKHTEEGSPAHTTRVPTPQLLKLIDEVSISSHDVFTSLMRILTFLSSRRHSASSCTSRFGSINTFANRNRQPIGSQTHMLAGYLPFYFVLMITSQPMI
jgi:hypothetical protein